MKAIGFIFARGGSKGLPKKNLMKVGGISLVGRAVQQALAVPEIERVIISSDDPAIIEEAVSHGAEAPFVRPDFLSSDSAKEWDAWRHAVEWLHENEQAFDVFVSVPATAPLRLPIDIKNALDLYNTGKADLVITGAEAYRNPYFNMVTRDKDGVSQLVCSNDLISRRQDAPEVYDVTTVAYVTSSKFVMEHSSIWGGVTKLSVVPTDRSIDIDSKEDLVTARALYEMDPAHYNSFKK